MITIQLINEPPIEDREFERIEIEVVYYIYSKIMNLDFKIFQLNMVITGSAGDGYFFLKYTTRGYGNCS